jgi:hypothetical protein
MAGMDENPYKPPESAALSKASKRCHTWHPLTWGVIGFAIGTLAVAPFIMTWDLQGQIAGGMTFGGPLGAIAGIAHGLERRRKARGTQPYKSM